MSGVFPPLSLIKVSWRYLIRHRWQSALMVLGIALGVAVVVAIDLANASAGRAFQLSTESLTGRATHQITGGPQGLAEEVYTGLVRGGWTAPATPVVSAYVTSPQLNGRPMQLLGLDPFSDAPFRSFFGGSLDQLTAFFTRPGAVLLSQPLAGRYGLKLGDALTIEYGGRSQAAFVAGLLQPDNSLTERTLDGTILMDISTAQELTGQVGSLTRIDLILPAGQPGVLEDLRARLPSGTQVAAASARTGAVEQMTQAFRVNLSALSLLALVVGLFLIYNTMTFSVVQRRTLFGSLRCLGVTRQEVFSMVLLEAGLTGLVGAGLGIGLGILLGQVTVRMVSQTINDLYYTTTVQAVGLPMESLLKGGLLGLLATLGTAALPAWEAASVPPRAALLRSGLESKARRSVAWAAAAGGMVMVLAVAVFSIPSASLIVGFGGTLLSVTGAALLASAAVVGLIRLLAPLTGKLFGLVGRLAPRNLLNSLSRTAVAVTALMVAVAVTIGVGIMIDSFRHTVVVWLDETLQGDVYISAPSTTATTSTMTLDPAVIAPLNGWSGVAQVDLLRSTSVQARSGSVNLSATLNPHIGYERLFTALQGEKSQVWLEMQTDGVLMSEPLAYRLGVQKPGDRLELNTPVGWKSFRVIGIYYDYASNEGTLLMGMPVYRSLWQDQSVTAIGLRLKAGVSADEIARSLQDGLKTDQQLVIRPNSALRADVMTVFDRTFAITVALRILATLVAFVGVLSALFLLQIEKQREVGILRALGLTAGELRRMVLVETGLMGAAAGLLAMPVGLMLSLILIYVINRRSFGWTLQLSVEPRVLLEGLLVAFLAALLAGIYPALRMSRMPAAEAIRYE